MLKGQMMPPRRCSIHCFRAQTDRAFWVLLVTAVLGMGSLTGALGRQPGVWTGLTVAEWGAVLLLVTVLACDVLVALVPPHRRESAGEVNGPTLRARPAAGALRKIVWEPRRGQKRGGDEAGKRRSSSLRRSAAQPAARCVSYQVFPGLAVGTTRITADSMQATGGGQ